MSMSDSNITLDELMTSLKTPLPEIKGFLEIMWDVDDPSILDLDKYLAEDVQHTEEKKSISNEINESSLEKRKTVSDEKILSKRKSSEKSSDSISVDLDEMSVENVLATLRCKCKDYKIKYLKRAEVMQSGSSFSDVSYISTTSKGQTRNIKLNVPEVILPQAIFPEVILPKVAPNCKQFINLKDYAVSFVDDILQEAEEVVNPFRASMDAIYFGEDADVNFTSLPSQSVSTENILPPTDKASWISYLLIEDFSPLAGRKLILETIQNTWKLKNKWSFCINYKSDNSDTCANFYNYEVLWSMPIMYYPIPQVTVSVYFTIEVSRIKPKECPVNVSYQFETERYKFTLEDDIQQETFLINIMKCKLAFFKSLRM